jgi:hypothetical protein
MVTVLFPPDVCDSRNWNRFGELGVHLMDGSWRIKSNFLHRRIALYWESWRMQRLLRESRKLGPLRRISAGNLPAGNPEIQTTG